MEKTISQKDLEMAREFSFTFRKMTKALRALISEMDNIEFKRELLEELSKSDTKIFKKYMIAKGKFLHQ